MKTYGDIKDAISALDTAIAHAAHENQDDIVKVIVSAKSALLWVIGEEYHERLFSKIINAIFEAKQGD